MSASTETGAIALLREARRRSGLRGHRRLVVLAGDRAWSRELATNAFGGPGAGCLWLGDAATAPGAQPAHRACGWLGRELDVLVVDAWAGLNPDVLAALAGCLRGGGALLLLVPPLQSWPDHDDPDYHRLLVHGFSSAAIRGRFLQRLVNRLRAQRDALILEQGRGLPALEAAGKTGASADALAGQRRAVDAICDTLDAGPLLLSADRGRGKSAALGLAAARLLQGRTRILLSAPRRSAADTVFEFAQPARVGAEGGEGPRSDGAGELRFMAPDALLAARPPADLLLVDEAAAIPLPLLYEMARQWPHCVFSSTEHGYEGSGRGFALRFEAGLKQLGLSVRRQHPGSPIRWNAADPLETALADLLLLDADAPSDLVTENIDIHCIDRDALIEDEGRLREIYGLLVAAHYRTTPDDLRVLLDGPNIDLWVATAGARIAAVALIAREGELDAALATEVAAGRRRPRGHLLPQTLAQYCAAPEACALRAIRILRIAVAPQLQRAGLGTWLLNTVAGHYRALGSDLIGASFGLTGGLLQFWSAAGFTPLRVGRRREASSGCHALLVAAGLSPAGIGLTRRVGAAFQRDRENWPRAFVERQSELARALAETARDDSDEP